MVQTAEQARALVRMARYPPQGRRGSAFSPRAAGYGAFPGEGHTTLSNEGIALIAMIETPEAVAQAGEIAVVEGIDAVFIGPNDLSHAMGFGSDWRARPVTDAIEQAIRAVVGAGKCAGTLAPTREDEERFAACGARYFASVATAIITQALRRAAA
jgi:4-hydroxy-2-oxoheptanedioate aldolase